MFGLSETVEPKVKTEPGRWRFLDESNLFLANGRSGIMILIELLGPASIWMPSFFALPCLMPWIKRKQLRNITRLITISGFCC